MTTPPDPNDLLMGGDPIPACATPDQRALLEWATANKITSPHPGMTKDDTRYSAPAPGESKPKARTRITQFSGALDDGEGLVRWRHRILAHGFANHVTVEPGDAPGAHYDPAIAKALHHAGEKINADVGTALHLAVEHRLTGTGKRPPAPWDADVDAFAATIAAHQLRVAHTEAVLWVPIGDGLCGTADLLVAGPWGDELRIVDIKTGSSAQRISYAVQLTCYSMATHRWTDTGWEPLPAIDPSVAYIAHMPAGSGTCQLVKVTLDRSLVDLAAAVRERRKARNVATMFATVEAPPSLLDEHQDVDGGGPPEKAPAVDAPEGLEWIARPPQEAMAAWFLERIRMVVAAGGEPAATLSRRWPTHISATEPATWTVEQMGELHVLLAGIEDDAAVPFPPQVPDDPADAPQADDAPLPPRLWDVPEPEGDIDQDAALQVTAAFAALGDEAKMLAATWARDGKAGGRRWAVGGDALTPRLLAVYQAVVACLSMWNGDAADCDEITRAALSIVIGEDVQPAWHTGAVLGALTIEQALSLRDLADAFVATGEWGDELSAKVLALTA